MLKQKAQCGVDGWGLDDVVIVQDQQDISWEHGQSVEQSGQYGLDRWGLRLAQQCQGPMAILVCTRLNAVRT